MWDSFTSGVAASIMLNQHHKNGENEFAEMQYMNITVVTSNEPYGSQDGSNPFFDCRQLPKFGLEQGGVHSGHVQTCPRDPFCIVKDGKGRCQDGFTKETTGHDSVRVLVATEAKPATDPNSQLNKAFFNSFLDVLNQPQQSGKFNFRDQFPYYREVLHKPVFGAKRLGKAIVFDMDMSPGDFLALLYLLKVPAEVINLKAIIVSPTGWANAATVDVVYDLLHMMGRDDIPVGLGEVIGTNQSDPMFPNSVGGCKYVKAIPNGSGGFLDSDTLFGLARDLPRSPRRYTAENSVASGAPRNTDHPELRQPQALEVWESVVESLESGSKVTLLTNGPLTNLARIIRSKGFESSTVEEVYVVGGHLSHGRWDKGNILDMHPNEYAEMNMFLDPLAAETVFESSLKITLIPLEAQRKVSSFAQVKQMLKWTSNKTPEAFFSHRLVSMLNRLKQIHPRYQHMDTFLGEILGAVVLAGDPSFLRPVLQAKSVKVLADGDESTDGRIVIEEHQGKSVKVLEDIDRNAYYKAFANQLGEKKQSAVVGSFQEQKRMWSRPPE
ncbi:Nucleoside hydrolase 3 [Linum grandiflorum]